MMYALVLKCHGVAQLIRHQSALRYISFSTTSIIGGVHTWGCYFFIEQRYKELGHNRSPIKILLVSFMCMLLVVVLDIWYCCAIENTFSDELLQAMRNYGIRREDRALVDQVQVHFKCCAINGYQDWLQTNASHILVANAMNSLSNNHWSHCTSSGCRIPWSCCQLNQLKCSSLIVIRSFVKNKDVANQRIQEWFYNKGCVGNVIGSISPLSVVIISLVNLILQTIALVVSQISTTARFVVHECGAPTGDIIVPAWILPFPKSPPNLLVKRCKQRIVQHRYFEENSFTEMGGITDAAGKDD
uniref:Tetraspanin n=2 Tax=Parascaris univalens TaxID=6257 RepID=A0A914ZWE3_PARUN